MSRRVSQVACSVFLLFLLSSGDLFSQILKDPENEYLRIRDLAFKGEYKAAAEDARKLINSFPQYCDARILLGRILAWQKDYKQALAVIDTVLMREPGNADAISARKDILLWSKGSSPVLTDVRAGYSFDQFSEPYHRFWQVFKAGAGHRFKPGPASGYINIGNLKAGDTLGINKTEVQLEVEAWPTLSGKNYAYLAYAYSPGIYFPRHRAAVEFWQILPAGFALSAGLNYYYFNRNIFIASLSLEKYAGNYWFSAKGYAYFKDRGPTGSVNLTARKYFNDTDYFQIGAGAGTAPDEPFDVQTDLMRLSAYSLRAGLNVSLSARLSVRAGAGYSIEEYADKAWRNRFEGNLIFIYALKMK